MDSYMFQTVGHTAVDAIAAAVGVPLYRAPLQGRSVHTAMDYTATEGDEMVGGMMMMGGDGDDGWRW